MSGADANERAALYRFLARAYLAPPDDDLLALASEAPELAPFAAGGGLAERHTELFDLHVYPYAAVFLDPSGMLDSPWSGFVGGVYRALGFEVMPGAGLAGPDHLSAQFEAVSALLVREAETASALDAERARHGQRTLLREQLAPWLPSFLAAVRRVDRGFYRALAGLTEEVVVDHASALWAEAERATDAAAEGPDRIELETFGPIADEPPPGFERLLVRAHGGLFLSRADLARLGERMALPLRFAERRFMLDHLVRGAAERDALPTLVALVGELVDVERDDLLRWSVANPAWTDAWRPWIERLDATAAWLEALKVEGAELDWRDASGGR